jgi:hypothetical protein
MAGRGVVDEWMRAYDEQRAAEYDDWWLGRGIAFVTGSMRGDTSALDP